MKKRIIITALSIMLASSTVMPAYAALPEGAPVIDLETISDSRKEQAALDIWADQYIDELKKIDNPKDRYKRAIEIVVTNWDPIKDWLGPDEALEAYLRGEIGIDQSAHIVEYMCKNTGIECMGGNYLQDGAIRQATVYARIDGVTYCYSWAALELWGMDDKYVFIDHDFNGIHIGDPFTPVEQPNWTRNSTFETISNMYNTIHVYDADGTLYTAAMNSKMVEECEASGHIYYKCVNNNFIAISEEEALALGYADN